MDRKLYKKHMQAALANYPNLEIRTANVKDIVLSPPSECDTVPRRVVGLRVSKFQYILCVFIRRH